MANPKNERVKAYIVISLACIAMIVAYFRFFRHKPEPTAAISEAPEQAVVYPIETAKTIIPPAQKPSKPDAQPISMGRMRDIFKRPAIPIAEERVEVVSSPGGKVFQGPAPQDIQLELKGTIVSGDSSMAIINDKFVRLGEKIENFRVIRITANEVVLKAGHYQRVIQVMKTEKYLSQ